MIVLERKNKRRGEKRKIKKWRKLIEPSAARKGNTRDARNRLLHTEGTPARRVSHQQGHRPKSKGLGGIGARGERKY